MLRLESAAATTTKKVSPKAGLPVPVANKVYKTCQTRGADDDEIFQNRVKRNSTVLIDFTAYAKGQFRDLKTFDKGAIVLVRPGQYFDGEHTKFPELTLGINLLVFYETRGEWDKYPVPNKWAVATKRTGNLGGQYVARVPGTTKKEGQPAIRLGFTTKDDKGAGIRVYEYANEKTIYETQLQLAYLCWRAEGMVEAAVAQRVSELRKATTGAVSLEELQQSAREHVTGIITALTAECTKSGLADNQRLESLRLLRGGKTCCPLCFDSITATELSTRLRQAEGRETVDLTVTAANLFHLKELRVGEYNHVAYNLGWGHHHCNTVVSDNGIDKTLKWMVKVLQINGWNVQAK